MNNFDLELINQLLGVIFITIKVVKEITNLKKKKKDKD
ncbi:hypothetical protein SAMN05444360_13412 [Chryseobacterium carnipullorum]|uniref:Uncharacterized protein n=1 Tax=Chryseobacterium oranimense TaxID=421058 RepID=A0A1M5X9K8_9FLAO|nr:hypothetical protein SAMN05421866_0065 [Chryseobacterium oranimense]SHN06642.1 hypothetical protein SAMN05444360_13412 [Chryseobacterium carnipullorum]